MTKAPSPIDGETLIAVKCDTKYLWDKKFQLCKVLRMSSARSIKSRIASYGVITIKPGN